MGRQATNQDTHGGAMSSSTIERPHTQPEKDTSASDVLTNRDLLEKILLCLGCRSCIIGAALTSKRWLRVTSRLSVSNFCVRHQPCVLGVYISSCGISGSKFIPLLQSDVLNHANFGFDGLLEPNVCDCQNGVILFEFDGETSHHASLAACSPLRYPNMDKAVVLPQAPQLSCFSEYPHSMLLPVDHGDDASCYSVNVRVWDSNNLVTVLVWVLRSGSWSIHYLAMDNLAKSPIQILQTTVLADGNIYMATEAGFILGLNLATKEFCIVDLPEGVEQDQYLGNLVHCRGDDSVLYLFHVDRDNCLNVWLRRMNDDHEHNGTDVGEIAKGWVLKDTISLCETCSHLMEQGWEMADDGDEDDAIVMVVGTGDNAEFVFLELGITGVIVYMHLKTRLVKQVYQRDPNDDSFISVHPFMFVRPPVLLVQDVEEGEAALLQD